MSQPVVLNVDDTRANRYLKSRALRAAGFEVIEAETGRAALELAQERRPDVVLLDIKLPDINGLEVCRRLKNDAATRHIPVVHISATFVGDETKAGSVQAGAEIYLAEPVGPQELTSTVRTVMRLRATERNLAESETRLRLATEGAGIASWDLPVDGARAAWSAHFYSMLGLDPASAPAGLQTWLARVRAADRAAVAASLERALRSRESFAAEHWILRADDGKERCIAVFGMMQTDDAGRAKRLIGVATDITERKRVDSEREAAVSQARAAQKEAEDAARMKDEFLAILSHELRTPMAAVLGWLHLVRGGSLPPEEQAKALAVVERNAKLQVQLVNDLLDVSRIITGKLELEDELVPLEAVLHDAVESVRPSADAKRIAVHGRFAPGPWPVRGSAGRLEQVFGNLLSNAVKFSAEGGRVEVSLERKNGHAVVTVADEGEGIDVRLLPHIFESFRQADSSTRRRHGGLGLGLAIVRSLVELHGGRVLAESAGASQGARFSVVLPLAAGAPAVSPDEAAQPAVTPEVLRELHVLVVDDEADHRELVRRVLDANGARVRTAAGAHEALAMVADWRPALLVLDIAMPAVDGYDLLARLRGALQASAETLPAVALTGFAAKSDAARALQSGFQAHQAKLFDPPHFISLIARLAARRRHD